MRMRTLELPTIIVGPAVKTPFVIILDRFSSEEEWTDEMADSVKEATGADGVIAFRDHEIELYNDVTEEDLERIRVGTHGD